MSASGSLDGWDDPRIGNIAESARGREAEAPLSSRRFLWLSQSDYQIPVNHLQEFDRSRQIIAAYGHERYAGAIALSWGLTSSESRLCRTAFACFFMLYRVIEENGVHVRAGGTAAV